MIPGPGNSLFFEHNPEPMFYFDEESLQILDVNRVAVERYEYNKEEFRTLTIRDLRPAERIPEMKQFFSQKASMTGNIGIWEHQTKSGHRFYVEIFSERFEHDGRPVKLALVKLLDNLTREEVISHAARYELQYHLEHSSLGIIQWNSDARIQYISERISEFVGYPTNELIGKSVDEFLGLFVKMEKRASTLMAFQHLVTGNMRRNTIDIRLQGSNGGVASFRFYNSALHRQNGQLLSVLSVIENLSEVEQTRHQLRQQELMLSRLFENSPIGLVQIDVNGNILQTNSGFRQIFGYQKQELSGKHLDDLISPPELRLATSNIVSVQEGALGTLQIESVRLRKDGKRIPVLIGTVPIFTDSDHVTSFIMYVDITERKNYEKKLIASLEDKQVLLQEIHHRVKNNLAVISGLLELQMISIPHPDVRKALGDSQLRIKSMALIHEQLYESKQLSRIDLDQVIENLMGLELQALDPGRNVRITLESDPITLNINQALPVTLIVNELVSNAFKHAFKQTDQGHIRLSIKQKGQNVSISIIDNGTGFPESVLEGQADSMGFTIVYTLIEQLHSELHIFNNPGGHVHFMFRIEKGRGSSSTFQE